MITIAASLMKAREIQVLPFAAGQVDALVDSFAQNRIETSGQLFDEFACSSFRRSANNPLLVVNLGNLAEPHIISGRQIVAGEILKDDPHITA
ncbi:MAG: hypothetical protein OXH52_04615 [Gammaproteobacteria bacterium]|nr:hypothetical protein [Gammaproteobacteria bacterium]